MLAIFTNKTGGIMKGFVLDLKGVLFMKIENMDRVVQISKLVNNLEAELRLIEKHRNNQDQGTHVALYNGTYGVEEISIKNPISIYNKVLDMYEIEITEELAQLKKELETL